MKLKSSIWLLMIIFTSCNTKEFSSADEIVSYISDEENMYSYSKTVRGVKYVLQYRPTDLMVYQELDCENSQEIEKLRSKYRNQLYFNLSMSMDDKEILSNVTDKAKFGEVVNELVFNMNNKIHIISAQKDTLPIIDFIYPRMYGAAPATTILIVYPREEKFLKQKYLNFVIEDIGLHTGEVRFKFKTQPLINEPKLNLNKYCD